MNAAGHLEARLLQLQAAGALPRSQCSTAFLALLAPLLKSDVVVEERAPGGRRLIVRDASTLRDFITRTYPNAPTATGSLSRTVGIARFRDSKALANDTPEIVHIRASREGAIIQGEGESPIPAVQATQQHGVFSFLLGPDPRPYTLHGPCALVENPAVFLRPEHLGLDTGLVLYGRGRASQRLLDWLTAQSAPDFTLLHLPDYDPIGLQEFERLRTRLGERVRLHLPEDLEARFATFANRTLLDHARSRSILLRLRSSATPEVRQVVALIDQHNAGLEQEALLL